MTEDVKVVCDDQKATDWIGEFFSSTNFMTQAQATVVRAFGLGTGAWALWIDLDRKKVRIRNYDARMVMPLTWDENGVTVCAFITRAFYRGKAVDQLQMHLRGGVGFSAGSSSPYNFSSSPEHADALLNMDDGETYRIVTVCFDHEGTSLCPWASRQSSTRAVLSPPSASSSLRSPTRAWTCCPTGRACLRTLLMRYRRWTSPSTLSLTRLTSRR